MDFDPNEFGVGLETAEEAFAIPSGSLASFSSLEDANQVVQSMGGVLAVQADTDVTGDIPQGMPVEGGEAEENAEVTATEKEQSEQQLQGPVTRKRKKDKAKAVVGIENEKVRAGEDAVAGHEGSKRACTDDGNELEAGMVDRLGDHPEMMKRMDAKIAKFREYVMGLSVHSNMVTSDLARAMARVAKVPGEVMQMDGVSKMNLGVETLSALVVAVQNANKVFDMYVNDENLFRNMEQGLRNAVKDLETANGKVVAAGELLARRESEIAVLTEKLKVETGCRLEQSKKLACAAEELHLYKVLFRAATLWVRRVKEQVDEKARRATVLSAENEKLRQDLEAARKEARELRALAGDREEKLIKIDRMMIITAAYAAGHEIPPEVIFSPNVYDKAAQAKAVEFCGRFKKK